MKRRRLILVGAGDFAREVLWGASEVPFERRDWEVYGLLDDNPDEAAERLQRYGFDFPVLGRISDYQPADGDCFIPAIGSAKGKLATCDLIRQRGGQFINIIDPTAAIGPGAQLGHGLVVGRHVIVSVNSQVGDFTTLLSYTILGHDAVVGEGSTICAHCDINGHALVERGVFVGSHAVVLPHARVGEFATVGAGSVVLKRVKPGETVFGVPARALSSGPHII